MKSSIIILGVTSALILNACTKPNDSQGLAQSLQEDSSIIKSPCAIVISPTEANIDSLKTTLGEENFYAVADDNQFYIAEATAKLDSTKTKIIYKAAYGMLKFRLSNGEVLDFDISRYAWAIILFNGRTGPIVSDMTNIQSDYEKYMN